MDFETYVFAEKKQCPFCAETILAKAIKCRYCGEFLNTQKADALQSFSQNTDQADLQAKDDKQDSKQQKEDAVFKAAPSLFSMSASLIKGMLLIAFAFFLISYPLENLAISKSTQPNSVQQKINLSLNPQVIKHYRHLSGCILAALVILRLSYKALIIKSTHYEVTPERIEYARGILDRKVDNIDMFRVVDLSLRRSMLDCVLGIGSVTLVTNDKTDPKFHFLKVRQPRKLYDLIKVSSLKADRKNSVIHIES